MKLLTKFGGLVAVAAILMAAGSLLVSPTPVSAAAGDICRSAVSPGGTILGNDGGTAAVTTVASGSTTKVKIYLSGTASTAPVTLTADAGTFANSLGSQTLAFVNGTADHCQTALATLDDDTADDSIGSFTYTAPTVTTDTIVIFRADTDLDGVADSVGSITVSATVTPDTLTLSTPTSAAIKATPNNDAASHTQITVTLKEGTTALVGQTVTLITTLGLLETDGSGACLLETDNVLDDGAQACTATTITGGVMVASLYGGGQSGTATISAVKGSLSATQDVTLFGAAASATGILQSSTLQATATSPDNRTFAVITVVDAVGNVVSGVTAASAVTGATTVVTKDDAATNAPGTVVDCTAGTNAKGECYIELTSSATSSSGDHTVTVTVAGVTAKVVLTLKIVGATATITSDAPASVAGSSQTEIIATGVDANGDAVGAVATTATIIEGNGGLLNVDAKTLDGQQKFTFVAPSGAGTTTILVTMGTVSQLITVSVGAAVPTPGEGFGGALSSGVNLTTYGGGTVEQLGADGTASGATSVAVTIDGAFVVYVVGAPAFVNQAFSDQYPDGVPAGTVVLVLVN